MPTPIEGVNVAALSPQRPDGREADVGALLEFIDFVCDAGVRGIALLGSTGEFVHFEHDERVRMVYMAVKRSRVPVLAGVAHSTLRGALDLGREACSAGAAGLLLMPPYFFRYSQAEVETFYRRFADQIGSNVRTFLYNIPPFTTEIKCQTAAALLSTGQFAGIKDSSGDFDLFLQLRALREKHPFTLLVGHDAVFARALAAGADGVISGVASAVPELLVGLDRAVREGAIEHAKGLEERLAEFLAWIQKLPAPIGIKLAARTRGLQVGPLSLPLSAETQKVAEAFQEWFAGWLPEVQREAARA